MNINLAGVVSSVMFTVAFKVRRRKAVVSTAGRTKEIDEFFEPVYGLVTPEGDNTQKREKDYATGQKTISVITRFGLRDQVRCALPDLVIWRGDTYLVETVDDCTSFGPGWVEAMCISQDLQDAAPMAAGQPQPTPQP